MYLELLKYILVVCKEGRVTGNRENVTELSIPAHSRWSSV